MARWWLGLDFSMVEEISTGKVKFRETQKVTTEALTQVDARLSELADRVAELERITNDLRNAGTRPLSPGEEKKAPNLVTDETAQTHDATAQLAKLRPEEAATLFKGQMDFIWIGDYDAAAKSWKKPKLLRLDSGEPFLGTPEALVPGSKYRVAGNMVLRGGLPENNEAYYRGQPIVGAIPRGTTVEALASPKGIDRQFAVQYWMKIRVAE